LLDQLGPFLEQLNPILVWLEGHQQLTADFITNGGGSFFARTLTFGGHGTGHYLRQFGPSGPETLSISPQRDPNNRGNDYPSSLWLSQIFPGSGGGKSVNDWGLAAWDCKNATGGHDHPSYQQGSSSNPFGEQTCWTQSPQPGAVGPYRVPSINQAHYSGR
jgi:hypothetical protein